MWCDINPQYANFRKCVKINIQFNMIIVAFYNKKERKIILIHVEVFVWFLNSYDLWVFDTYWSVLIIAKIIIMNLIKILLFLIS